MSILNLSLYINELQYKLLDWMDADGLCAMKKMHRGNLNDFESDSIVHYLLHDRLPRLIEQAKPHAWRSEQHRVCVLQFFKVVALLPPSVKFPEVCDYDTPSELKDLIQRLSAVISTGAWFQSDPLCERLEQIGNVEHKKMPAFMTLIPIRVLPSVKCGWAERSRRFSTPGINQDAFLNSFHFGITYTYGNGAYEFIQGVSASLLQAIFDRSVDGFQTNSQLIWGLTEIQDKDEAFEKLAVIARCFQNYEVFTSQNVASMGLLLHLKASSTMNILYMASCLDKKSPIDRDLVKSWIPELYLNDWHHFTKTAGECIVYPERNADVEETFGNLFIKAR